MVLSIFILSSAKRDHFFFNKNLKHTFSLISLYFLPPFLSLLSLAFLTPLCSRAFLFQFLTLFYLVTFSIKVLYSLVSFAFSLVRTSLSSLYLSILSHSNVSLLLSTFYSILSLELFAF